MKRRSQERHYASTQSINAFIIMPGIVFTTHFWIVKAQNLIDGIPFYNAPALLTQSPYLGTSLRCSNHRDKNRCRKFTKQSRYTET